MFRGDGSPEIIPGMGIVVQLEQNFEASDCGLTIRTLKFFVRTNRLPIEFCVLDAPTASSVKSADELPNNPDDDTNSHNEESYPQWDRAYLGNQRTLAASAV